MTLEEFSSKAGDVQVNIAKESGVLIGKREHTYHNIQLYQVDTFYVEVFFRKKDDSIWKVGAFDHLILLQPYLDQVDISNLLPNT
jgi:hypothetical protein